MYIDYGNPQASAVTFDIAGDANNLTVDSDDSLSFNRGTSLTISGTSISNAGSIVINGGGATNTSLILDSNVTLSGGGKLTLSTAGGGGDAFIQPGAGSVTLTNVDNTIRGNGIIGNGALALNNKATINANVSGAALTLNGSG